MATKDFKFYLYLTPHSRPDEPDFALMDLACMADHGYVLVREEIVTVELPDARGLQQKQLAALERLKQDTRAKFAKAIKEIDDRINSLLAIENSAPGDSF